MIGWKCSYGTIDMTNKTFTPLDTNKIFSFGTNNFNSSKNYTNFCSTNWIYYYEKYTSANSLAEYLLSIYGKDYYTMYFLPTSNVNSTYILNLKSVFPSAILNCPNTANSTVPYQNAVYIPKLKRYIYQLSVLDESFNTLYQGPFGNGQRFMSNIQSENYCGYLSCVNFDGTKDSVLKANNWKYLCVLLLSDNPFGYYTSDFTEGSFLSGFLQALFGDYDNPDINTNITDPYNPGEPSTPGGGEGDFNGDSDPIDIPDIPTLSATDSGFLTLFNPTPEELKNLASYMWSDLFDINGWKKIFADPMDAILGLSIVPVTVPNSGTAPVKVGNISTGISMTKASSQFVTVDCGTLNVNEYWGGYLDYDPYTKAELYLPYIGTHVLSVDDIMGKAIHIVYNVDILSGSCCAFVKCGESVIYNFSGQCSSSIPITGNDWTNVVNGALSIAASIGTMIATGGSSAPLSIGAIATTSFNSMKPSIEKSGALGGVSGMLGIQKPYLILTRPRQALPNNQNTFMGYPSFITAKLSTIEGYTEIEEIHLENISGTEAEITEIETLLKEGVIF